MKQVSYRGPTAIPLHPLWIFVASYRVNFTILTFYRTKFTSSDDLAPGNFPRQGCKKAEQYFRVSRSELKYSIHKFEYLPL